WIDVTRQCACRRRHRARPLPIIGVRPRPLSGVNGRCLDLYCAIARSPFLDFLGRARDHHVCRAADDLGRLDRGPPPYRSSDTTRILAISAKLAGAFSSAAGTAAEHAELGAVGVVERHRTARLAEGTAELEAR